MVIITEKNQLDEMARLNVCVPGDNLPFDVVVQTDEHNPPHALLLEKNSKTKERGEFLIPDRPPRFVNDIQDYRKGISDKDREALFQWINQRNRKNPKLTNWESLVFLWNFAVD